MADRTCRNNDRQCYNEPLLEGWFDEEIGELTPEQEAAIQDALSLQGITFFESRPPIIDEVARARTEG